MTSERPKGPVKIVDVANLAGVAPMTVSRVINTPDRVSPATAARVRDAIAQLGRRQATSVVTPDADIYEHAGLYLLRP